MTRWIFLIPLVALLAIEADDIRNETWLSTDSSDSQLSFNFARCIAVGDAGEVHVAWFDTRVHYRRSIDDGRTWLSEIVLTGDVANSQHVAIAASGKYVYVVWHELHAKPRIVFRRSADGGVTWEPPQFLTAPDIHSAHPSIAAAGSRVHVTWFDGRHGLSEIYTRHSVDAGASWKAEQRLSHSDAESWVATIESAGDDVLVVWVDYADGNEEEYLRRSIDGGETWQPAVRLTTDDADSWAPSLVLSGNLALVSWFDRRDAGVSDADVEAKLNEAMRLVGLSPEPTPPRDPRIYYHPLFAARLQAKQRALAEAVPGWIASGGDPKKLDAVVHDLERLLREWAFGWEIYLKRSTDRGVTFSPDLRLTRAAGASQRPSLAIRGEHVSVVWFDDRDHDGTFDVYMKDSRDAGLTWSEDHRLTYSSAVLPSAARSAEVLHVISVGSRFGTGEIQYHRLPIGTRHRAVGR